jgi:DNA polymerase-1
MTEKEHGEMEQKPIMVVVDFNNMVFGSYYGQPLRNTKGVNINAVKQFFFKMQKLKEIFNPDYIVMARDLSRERTFRRKLFADYKAQRKPMDDDVLQQMRYIQQISALIGYPIISNETYEADDIMGMLSRMGNDNGIDVILVSTDRDLYQLVNDHTVIYNSRNSDIIDRVYIYEKYQLTPEQWIELKMLQGDRSDNIPGVPGIGETTALLLMQEYESIDGIYSHLGYLKSKKVRDLLLAGRDSLELTRELVTIITDYTKINLTMDDVQMKPAFVNDLYAIIAELEIPSLVNVMKYCLLLPQMPV